MAIANPVLFYTGPVSNILSGSSSAATGTDCPAGNLVVMGIVVGSGGQLASLSDSAGNVYTPAIRQSVVHDAEIWYCNNNLHLSSSGTFTATVVGGVLGYRPFGAIYVGGALGGLDQTAGLSIASGTTYTLTTPGLNVATAIAVGLNNPDGYTSYIEDPSWTELIGSPVSNNVGGDFAWKILANVAAPVTWAPNFTLSQRVDSCMAVFDITPQPPYPGFTTVEWG